MKFNLKKYIALMLALVVLAPGFAFAASDPERIKDGKENKGINNPGLSFCSRIEGVEQKIVDQITKAETKQSDYKKTRLDKVAKKEGEVDAKRVLGRGEADAKRIKNWDKMIGKSKTDAQKIAIEAYRNAVNTAVLARRTAVDKAVQEYRNGLDKILVSYNSTLSSSVAIFKTSVDSALSKAKADCAAGIASNTAKENFNKTISEAKKTLETARKNAELNSGITALKKIRNDAVETAVAIFKTATEKARADLMLAIKK